MKQYNTDTRSFFEDEWEGLIFTAQIILACINQKDIYFPQSANVTFLQYKGLANFMWRMGLFIMVNIGRT